MIATNNCPVFPTAKTPCWRHCPRFSLCHNPRCGCTLLVRPLSFSANYFLIKAGFCFHSRPWGACRLHGERMKPLHFQFESPLYPFKVIRFSGSCPSHGTPRFPLAHVCYCQPRTRAYFTRFARLSPQASHVTSELYLIAINTSRNYSQCRVSSGFSTLQDYSRELKG